MASIVKGFRSEERNGYFKVKKKCVVLSILYIKYTSDLHAFWFMCFFFVQMSILSQKDVSDFFVCFVKLFFPGRRINEACRKCDIEILFHFR